MCQITINFLYLNKRIAIFQLDQVMHWSQKSSGCCNQTTISHFFEFFFYYTVEVTTSTCNVYWPLFCYACKLLVFCCIKGYIIYLRAFMIATSIIYNDYVWQHMAQHFNWQCLKSLVYKFIVWRYIKKPVHCIIYAML